MTGKLAARGRLRAIASLTAVFVVVCALSMVPVVRELQLRLTDSYFRAAPAPSQVSPVMLVLIDDESLRRYGRWPWPRTLMAQLTRNLERAGAAAIGIDILLAEAQSSEADSALGNALANRVVLVDKIGVSPEGPRWIEPVPELARAAAAIGHAQAVLDRDGICRRFPPLEVTTDGPRWAFAVEVARRFDPAATSRFLQAQKLPANDDSGPVMIAKPLLVRVPFRSGDFGKISASEVLQERSLDSLRGRAVIVGFGPTEISDRLITPLGGELPTPGAEVHAHIVDGILAGRLLRDLPLYADALVLLLTCALVVFVFSRYRGWPVLGILIGIAASVYATGWVGFHLLSFVLPIGPMMLVVIVGPLLVYTADFIAVEHSLSRQLAQLQGWLATRHTTLERTDSDLSWKLRLLHDLQSRLGSLYELHETLVESTQDLVAIFDDSGSLLLVNRAFGAAFHPDAEAELDLKSVRARLTPDDNAPLTSSGDITAGEAYVNGELFFVRIVPLPPTTLSPAGGTVVLLTSLATRVERDRARAEALGFITHELRTPLVSIQGFAEVLLEYPHSPACARAPETIFRESKRLLALINSYLDVLRLDAGARPVRRETVKLDEVVEEVFELLQPLSAAAGMQLVVERTTSPEVTGDRALLTGAVLNLVSNAIKYGTSGTDIRVMCLYAGDTVELTVHNQGSPIPATDIERLFRPFYRNAEVETKTGWGLGLAFVKRIAEKHGGSVHVTNVSDGVSFAIRLPAKVRVLAAKGKR